MRVDVDQIDDIEQLREIAKFRGAVIDSYEALVNEIVPQAHPAWNMPRDSKGNLPVLLTYLRDVLEKENIYEAFEMERVAGFLHKCISNSVRSFFVDMAKYGYELDPTGQDKLVKRICANFLSNDSLFDTWHRLRTERRKEKITKILKSDKPEIDERTKKYLLRELRKCGVIIDEQPQLNGGGD